MFERFTDSSRQVLVLAQEEARQLDSGFIGTEHLLLGLMREETGIAAQVLAGFDICLPAVRAGAAESIGFSGTAPSGSPPFTPRAKKVLELSLRETLQLGHHNIGTEHILLGLLREGEGVGVQILVGLGVDLARVRQQMSRLLSAGHDEPDPEMEVQAGSYRRPSFGSRIVACSFCGRTPPESGQLIAGDEAFICERCLRQWVGRVDQLRSSQGRRGLTQHQLGPPGPQPEDPDAARAEISAVYSNHGTLSEDGQSLPLVEKGEQLGPTLAAAKEQRPDVVAAEVVISIDDLVLSTPSMRPCCSPFQ